MTLLNMVVFLGWQLEDGVLRTSFFIFFFFLLVVQLAVCGVRQWAWFVFKYMFISYSYCVFSNYCALLNDLFHNNNNNNDNNNNNNYNNDTRKI